MEESTIVISDGTSVGVGSTVHFLADRPYEHLVNGRIQNIRLASEQDDGLEVDEGDSLEVDVDNLIVDIPACLAFHTRKSLVDWYIKSLLRRIKTKEERIKDLQKEIELVETEIGQTLVSVHDLKKEIGLA